MISTAPDFDHLILVQVGGRPITNPLTGRKVCTDLQFMNENSPRSALQGPVLVQFPVANTFANRLVENMEYKGTVFEVNAKGQVHSITRTNDLHGASLT